MKAYKKVNGTWVEQTTLTGLFDTTKSYVQYYNWYKDKVLPKSNGETSASNWVTTDYIAVTPGVGITVTGQQYTGSDGVMWDDYSQDKSYHDYWSNGGGTTIATVGGVSVVQRTLTASNMANVYYVRINCLKEALSYCKVV